MLPISYPRNWLDTRSKIGRQVQNVVKNIDSAKKKVGIGVGSNWVKLALGYINRSAQTNAIGVTDD